MADQSGSKCSSARSNSARNRDPFHYYLAFIAGGFEIPVAEDEAAKVRKLMTAHEAFAEYLEQRSRHEDDVINRDM